MRWSERSTRTSSRSSVECASSSCFGLPSRRLSDGPLRPFRPLQTLQNTLLPGLDYPVDEMNQLWTDQGGEGAFAPRLAPGRQASSSPSAKNPAPDPDSSPLTALTPTSVGSLIVPLLSARPAVDDTGEGPMNDDDDAGVDQSS